MVEKTRDDGDCSIYSSLVNGRPEDGICTCGYGRLALMYEGGNDKEMYSDELREKILRMAGGGLERKDGIR